MTQSPPPTTPIKSEQEIYPQPPPLVTPSPPIDTPDQEPPPYSPEIDYLDERGPSPPGDVLTSDPDDNDPEIDDPDEEDEEDPNKEGPPPPDREETLFFESDEEEPPPIDEDDPDITLQSMKTNLEFVRMVEEATLETQFSKAELHAFRNPYEVPSPCDDPDLCLSISFYMSTLDHAQSQNSYTSAREAILVRVPESKMLSYDQVKRYASNVSGVVTWKYDMCVDSCAAFTGPFAQLEECPLCHKHRYDQEELRKSNGKKKVPRKVCTTFPAGPQIQARWRGSQMAQQMFYRRDKTKELLQQRARGETSDYDDIFCGSDYLDAVKKGSIKDYDTVVMLSIDGAQLYRNKKSDCWMYIFIILDLAPDRRYKIRNILPGGIIPGPKNPKHLDSFLFPGLAHISAIQKEGMHIWDGYNRMAAISFLILLLVLADAVGMAELSGSVGHHGRKGCRILCGLFGRNKPGGSHYYPVLLRPLDSNIDGSNHPDFDINDLPKVNTAIYKEELKYVLSSPNEAEYRKRRLETGIRKASIFDGIPRILDPPTCFPGDIMHQPVINLASLMLELWTERADGCRKGDNSRDVWDWAVLKGDVWKAHGQAVADAAPCFPRSFDRTPRNPAEKLSSGYKAWELLLYFYGLGPGLFYGVLPEKYYQHYCKLVVAIRIMYQHSISPDQLRLAHQYLLEWVLDFERLYYGQKTERLHFVRQCVHSLVHLVPETLRIGPPSLTAQWTMERMIGYYGSLIKQPSNPFANLAELAKKVAVVNSIVAVWPTFERVKKDPRGSLDVGDEYLLLGPKDKRAHRLSEDERTAFEKPHPGLGPIQKRSVFRWARLQIPTGQITRSYWKEVTRISRTARSDRNVKVSDLISVRLDSNSHMTLCRSSIKARSASQKCNTTSELSSEGLGRLLPSARRIPRLTTPSESIQTALSMCVDTKG